MNGRRNIKLHKVMKQAIPSLYKRILLIHPHIIESTYIFVAFLYGIGLTRQKERLHPWELLIRHPIVYDFRDSIHRVYYHMVCSYKSCFFTWISNGIQFNIAKFVVVDVVLIASLIRILRTDSRWCRFFVNSRAHTLAP